MGPLALPLEGSESGLTFVQKDLPCSAGWGRDREDAEVVERPRVRAPGPGGEEGPGAHGGLYTQGSCHGPEKPSGLTH